MLQTNFLLKVYPAKLSRRQQRDLALTILRKTAEANPTFTLSELGKHLAHRSDRDPFLPGLDRIHGGMRPWFTLTDMLVRREDSNNGTV